MCFCLTIMLILISIISIIILTWKNQTSGVCVYNEYLFLVDSNKILPVLLGLSSFLLFKNLKIKYNPFINTIASTCFGVLLIHANSDVMRQWLWVDLFKNTKMYDSSYYYLYAIGSVFSVFAVCSIIDYLRIEFIEKPFFKLLFKE